MRILLVHKFLYPKGGAETYVLQLGETLTRRGHTVAYFGLNNPQNTVGNPENLGVTNLDLTAGAWKNLTAPFRILYCAEARGKLYRLLESFRPEVVHLNNFHYHLTPSILLAIRDYRSKTGRKVKTVYTAHDYQLVCPSHGLFDRNCQPCEKCLDGKFRHCFQSRCLKGSYLKSLLGTLEAALWQRIPAYDEIDTILCCSAFLKQKLDTQPRFRGKTVVLQNFAPEVAAKPPQPGCYVLQLGHLSRDKGTDTLLEAAKALPNVEFRFAGRGPAAADMMQMKNVRYLGFLSGPELEETIRNAAVTVCPSKIYENCPYAVLESLVLGTPVLGSRIGGIPELIREGKTGELFRPGDPEDLKEKLLWMLEANRLAAYTQNCAGVSLETTDSYCEKLMRIYGEQNDDL